MNAEDLTLEATHSPLAPSFASDGDRSLDRRHRGPRRRAISHDPLCPIQRETWCIWPGDKCDRCALIVRVRDEALDAAREAVAALSAPYKVRAKYETYASYHQGKTDMQDLAVDAIDALREKK